MVWAICEVATAKFSTARIALSGSTTTNMTTAFTRAGTLSRVMISCGGMVNVTNRWSTRIIRSTKGISTVRPGWYSGRT